MNGVGGIRRIVAVVAIASGAGVVAAGSASAGAAATAPGGCAGKAYVTNNVDGTVTVITTATGAVYAPITVGNESDAVAITPDGKHAYVTNDGDGTVSVITTATGCGSAPITVGKGPARWRSA